MMPDQEPVTTAEDFVTGRNAVRKWLFAGYASFQVLLRELVCCWRAGA